MTCERGIMLRIGICEDDKNIREQLHNVISKNVFQYTDTETQYYADGEEVIQAIQQGIFQVDLLFLDIHMQKVNGMKTAEYIRNHNIDVDIIFLTVSKEHVFEGYTYKAFAYCLKPIEENKLSKELLRYLQEKNQCSECLNITMKGKEQRIPLNKILYFESDKRKVIAHTVTEDITFYAKMDEIDDMLDEKLFLRCHQSYIVNRAMIDSMKRTEIIVQGMSIPMSRKYYENLCVEEDTRSNLRVTKSLALNQKKTGAIVFVKGKNVGAIIRINDQKNIVLGRDGNVADIVINDTKISRRHCCVTYHQDTGKYTICDFSKNGIFNNKGKQYPKDTPFQVEAGEEIWIGSSENVFQLG